MPHKYNILLLMTDQLRWDSLGCTGSWIKTPNIDKLAKNGYIIRNCITNSPVCIPTRLSFATGLYPHNTGVWENQPSEMSPNQPNWMKVLQNSGYHTCVIGKTHLHPHDGDLREKENLMEKYGFDYINEIAGPRASCWVKSHMTCLWEKKGIWKSYQDDFSERFSNKPHLVRPSVLEYDDYYDVYIGQCAKKYLKDLSSVNPWFCWVSFSGPHEPWDTPEPYANIYNDVDINPPYNFKKETLTTIYGELYKRYKISPSLTEIEIDEMRRNYAGNVTLIDYQIGEIVQTLKDKNELDQTLIIFTSDHGEQNGDHGLIYKETFFNSSVLVPLIIRPPNNHKINDSYIDSPIEWFDIGPTILEYVGCGFNYPQFSKSFCPLLNGKKWRIRDDTISEYKGELMMLNDDWKIVFNKEGLPYLLFDRNHDPQEAQNLSCKVKYHDIMKNLKLRAFERLMSSQMRGNAYKYNIHGDLDLKRY